MSSVLRYPGQIPARIRYFLAVQSYTPQDQEGTIDSGDSAITFPDGYTASIVVEDSLTVNYVAFSTGDLLKDLGRNVIVVDSENRHIARYREVQRVNGADTEGVNGRVDPLDSAYGCFFVKTWSADGLGVYVVRTG
jgi:hypothetical protein